MMLPVQGEKTDDEFRREVGHLAESLGAMMRTGGWHVYEAYLRSEAAAAAMSLANAKTGDEALRAGTAFTILTRVADLPRKQMEEAVKFLHPHSKKL
jgi:hypothetical protein